MRQRIEWYFELPYYTNILALAFNKSTGRKIVYGIGWQYTEWEDYNELFQVVNDRPLTIDKVQSMRFNMPVYGTIGLYPRSDSGTLDFFFVTGFEIAYLKAPTMNYPSVSYISTG